MGNFRYKCTGKRGCGCGCQTSTIAPNTIYTHIPQIVEGPAGPTGPQGPEGDTFAPIETDNFFTI